MQDRMRRGNWSLSGFLLTTFAAVALAVVLLPGCGDDTVKTNVDTDTGFFDSDSDSAPPQP